MQLNEKRKKEEKMQKKNIAGPNISVMIQSLYSDRVKTEDMMKWTKCISHFILALNLLPAIIGISPLFKIKIERKKIYVWKD